MRAARLAVIALPLALLFAATALASAAEYSEWSPPEMVRFDESYLDASAVAMGGNGNATAVWSTSGPVGGRVMASYLPGTGVWTPEEVLNVVEPNTTIYHPAVVMDMDGRAAAVWLQFWQDDLNATYPVDLYVDRYEPGKGWQGPELVGSLGQGYTPAPSIAFGSGGALFVGWSAVDTVGYISNQVRAYEPALGWGAPNPLDGSTATTLPEPPIVAADASGNAVATWTVTDLNGSTIEVWAAVYFPAISGWQPVERIDSLWGGGAYVDDVAMAGGTPVVLLSEFDYNGTLAQFVSRSWTEFGGWGPTEVVDPNNIGPREVAVVGDPSGRLTAVYTKRIAGVISVNGSSYVPGVGWHPWGLIETFDANATQLAIASDNDGGAVAAWVDRNATVSYIGAARFRPSFGWEEAPAFDDIDWVVSSPTVGASRGSAIVGWVGLSSYYNVRAARFTRDTVAPGYLMVLPGELVNQTDVQVAGYCLEYPCVVTVEGISVAAGSLNGDFSVVLNLSVGTHYLSLSWVDREGNANYSVVQVTVDLTSYLQLTSPAYVLTTTRLVAITGMAEPGSVVLVNGSAAQVGFDGAFEGLVVPAPGNTTVQVVARDRAGNTNTTSVQITFNDPAVALGALEQELAQANATLALAVQDLSAAQARLEQLESDSNATAAALAEARANVTLAKSAADAAALQVSLAQANMTAANARADDASRAAASAQGLAMLGVLLGIVGAGIGAVALMRSGGGGGGMHAREKANKTKSLGNASAPDPGQPTDEEALKVKEKGNRTK